MGNPREVERKGRRAASVIIRPNDNQILTSGQAARMLQVAPRTLNKQMDAGKIKGFRLPTISEEHGDGDRRFYLDDVLRYMHSIGMRVDPRLDDSADVVAFAAPVKHDKIQTFTDSLEFGVYLGSSYRCKVAIVGTEYGTQTMRQCIDLIKKHQPTATIAAVFHESEYIEFEESSNTDLKFILPHDTMNVIETAKAYIRPNERLLEAERNARRRNKQELKRARNNEPADTSSGELG